MTGFTSARPKLLYLEGLRGSAAVYVVLTHIFLSFDKSAVSKATRMAFNMLEYGHYAVCLFIVLSGYCLMLQVVNSGYRFTSGIGAFYKRRFLRIYPSYLCSVFLAAIAGQYLINEKTGTLWDMSLPLNAKGIVTHLFMVHDLFYDTVYSVNYVLWSVSVEFRIYVLFPLLLWEFRKFHKGVVLVLTVITSFLIWKCLMVWFHYNHSVDVSGAGVHPFIILFVLGMAAATVTDIKTKTFGRICLLISLLSIILIEVFYKGQTIKDIAAGVVFAALILVLRNEDTGSGLLGRLKGSLSTKPAVFTGTFAYSIYLFHPIYLQLFIVSVVKPLGLTGEAGFWLTITLGTIAIIATCYLSFLFFEKPFLKLLSSRKNSAITSIKEPAV